jgi:hypothetical protein
MSAPDSKNVLAALWCGAGFDEAALSDVDLTGVTATIPPTQHSY